MKTFDFAVAILVVFGLFIYSSVGNVYAQNSTDIKESDDAEHAQLPHEKKYEAASESEIKNIRPTTRETLRPVSLKRVMDSPSNPGNDTVSGASGDSLMPADCCVAHTCCP